MTFKELGLIPPILEALTEQGYERPSPIQEKAIAPALAGRDVLGCAQTGTGKTCAFATPILQQLSKRPLPVRAIRALILTPTRELALQIQESFVAYGKHLSLRSAVIFGGVGQAPQVDKLKRGLDILVATPGRLMDLQGQGFVDLSKLEIFVLDEADRMLDMGFIHDVRRILQFLPEQKQTLFFSATMPPEITQLVNSLLKNPVKVAVDPVSSPVEVIDQTVYLVDKGNKSKLLAQLMGKLSVKNALIFTRTKHGANKVAQDLEKAGISAAAIHGNKSQTARQQALADFKSGKVRALVATDIAARGLDIEELSHVFNYNLPEVAETYIHRIGRTGRAGREGTAVSFCDFGEKQYLKDIERLIGKPVPLVADHDWPLSVFEVAVKDAHGKLVNADDAEARAAARDRKREREQASRAAAPQRTSTTPPAKGNAAKSQPARPARGPKAQPAPRQEPRKSHRGFRHEDLQGTMPAAPQMANGDFRKPNPLANDVIMDATARMLAPKPRPAQPAAQRQSQPARKPHPAEGSHKTQVPASRPGAPAKSPQTARPDPRKNRGGGRRGGPPEVVLRMGNQKDSTEQSSLMKPYYLNNDK
ncbi:MAG: DEAD/DEAH box helicase [Pseudoflavonifractor sp.]